MTVTDPGWPRTMRIERISLKTLTISVLIVVGLVSIALLFITTLYFREAALNSQRQSLLRVMEVSANEVMKQLHGQVFGLGTTLSNRAEFRAAFEQFRQGEDEAALQKLLDDPIVNGFVGFAAMDLAKLRLYSPELKFLAESRAGIQGLEPQLSPLLFAQAAGRSGSERLKALNGIWISPSGPLYSVLMPVGGLRLTGYLEIVVNPVFNLASVSTMTRIPMKLYGVSENILYQSEGTEPRAGAKILAVEYVMHAGSGEEAFRLVGLDDVSQLNADMARSGIVGGVAFFSLISASVLVGVWFLNRFLFRPMSDMEGEMERSAQGDLSVTVGHKNTLKEFHALAAAFNIMARKVESNIEELQRLSSVDGLTGINNRRHFDLSLQSEWLRAQRGGQDLSLLLLDIDFFKQYNDTYGHLGGDDCLRVVGALLRDAVQRPCDVVARYGGEEFAILLPDTQSQGAQYLAFKIAAELARLNVPHISSALGGRVTMSIGCATCRPNPQCLPDALVAVADNALYRAKSMGRDRVVAMIVDEPAGEVVSA